MDRFKKLQDFAAAVKKSYGHDIVSPAFKMRTLDIDRLPSGSVALDNVMGGGLPRGRVTMLWGEKSSGKTTIAKKFAGRAQGLCRRCWRFAEELEVKEIDYGGEEPPPGSPTHCAEAYCDCYETGVWVPKPRIFLDGNGKQKEESEKSFQKWCEELKENSYEECVVFWIDAEGAFDPKWAECQGVDLRRLFIARPEYAEQAIDIADSMLQTGACDLLIIDSLAALTPSDEREASTESWQQGLQARLLNKACRKWVSSTNDAANLTGLPPTMLWIQQVRQKIGVTFGSNKVKPGGQGQGFATSIEVFCWSSKRIVDEVQVGSTKDEKVSYPVSVRLNFKTDKNKTAPPNKTGYFVMSLRNDPDTGAKLGMVMEHKFVYGAATRFGIIDKVGSKYICGLREYTTQKAILDDLMNDEPFYEEIKAKILKRLREMES